jgi:RND family efflux transporter MFP subunit
MPLTVGLSTRSGPRVGSKIRLAFLALGLSGSLSACQEETRAVEQPVRPVRTQVVEISEQQHAESAIGEIRPRYETDVGFRIPGKIAVRLVDLGSVVQKGTIVAKLENTNEQNAVAITETDVRGARAEMEDAAGQESRQRDLLQRGFTTQVNYDAADRRLKLAKAKLESAELVRKNAIERLGYTELLSDDDGVVTSVSAQPGQVVAAGQPVIRIARTDAKEAEFKVAERSLRSIPADVNVEVSLLSDPSISASGKVREVATTADPVTRTFAVRVSLNSPPEDLRFGATVRGRIVLEEKGIVLLPSSALFKSNDGPAVWVYEPGNSTVALRSITVLRYESKQFLVVDGLQRGERVITAGVQKLWPGMKVKLL